MDTPGEKIPWPRGKYCIYRKGKTCPTGLQEGTDIAIAWMCVTVQVVDKVTQPISAVFLSF